MYDNEASGKCDLMTKCGLSLYTCGLRGVLLNILDPRV